MKYLIFDIETGPLPEEHLVEHFTFDESKISGFDLLSKEFDPSSVKLGNLKDPDKIQAKIDDAQADFNLKKSTAHIAVEQGRKDAWEKFVSRAALSPLTGQVLAVGFCGVKTDEDSSNGPNKVVTIFVDATRTEKELIEEVLETIVATIEDNGYVVGHNIIGFDIPFLIRRGLFYGIEPSPILKKELLTYHSQRLIDTIRYWQFGNRMEEMVKLDTLAKFFGTTRKNGNGAIFYKSFLGTPEEQLEALRYLENDIVMTTEIASKMRILL